MGQTLTNGVYLPDEGERNCYTGLAANWRALDAHLGDANIHVTYADKESWNNHIADTVKHVTAEDKTKWDAVTTKANDADVMHLTGNERSSGNKTFEGEIISNSSILISNGSDFVTGTKDKKLTDKNNFNILNERITYNNSRNVRYTWTIYNKDANGNLISSGVQLAISPTGQAYFYPINDNDILFGASTAYIKGIYTKLINSINPGSLFLPQDRSARVDISAYFTNTANGATNRVTSPDDGYIFLSVTDGVTVHCVSQNTSNLTHFAQTFARPSAGLLHCLFPVRKNDNVAVQWYTTAAAVTVSNAYFIPCKGNI